MGIFETEFLKAKNEANIRKQNEAVVRRDMIAGVSRILSEDREFLSINDIKPLSNKEGELELAIGSREQLTISVDVATREYVVHDLNNEVIREKEPAALVRALARHSSSVLDRVAAGDFREKPVPPGLSSKSGHEAAATLGNQAGVRKLNPSILETAHRRSRRNRQELEANDLCGCFSCVTIFSPREISGWIDDGQTALCPKCGIDAVLANTPVSPVTEPNFLNAMRAYASQK